MPERKRFFSIEVFPYSFFPQELFDSSKTVLGCIPASRFRVIHRSLLFSAVEEKNEGLLRRILDAIQAKKTKNLPLRRKRKLEQVLSKMKSKRKKRTRTQRKALWPR